MPPSADDKKLLDRIDHDFTYQPPHAMKAERYEHLRSTAKDLARLIVDLCPDSRERSLAITKLEEVVMWAQVAVARHEVG